MLMLRTRPSYDMLFCLFSSPVVDLGMIVGRNMSVDLILVIWLCMSRDYNFFFLIFDFFYSLVNLCLESNITQDC